MSKFVFGTSALMSENEAALVRFFDSRKLTWWHWLPNLWLVVSDEMLNAGQLRDDIRNVIGQDKEMLVLQVEGANWAGAAYDRNGAKMGDWLDGTWASK